ncbi:hypothetical protein ACFX2I_013147 [Malus domestica]
MWLAATKKLQIHQRLCTVVVTESIIPTMFCNHGEVERVRWPPLVRSGFSSELHVSHSIDPKRTREGSILQILSYGLIPLVLQCLTCQAQKESNGSGVWLMHL